MVDQKREETIRFEYVRADNYQVVYANGVFGGPSPRGDLRIDFFQEVKAAPEAEVYKVMEDGRLGHKMSAEPPGATIRRELQVRLILTLDNAESIANWILSKVKLGKTGSE